MQARFRPWNMFGTKGEIMKKTDAFNLKGYTLPLSLEGKAALIDPPPWHYGGDVMHLIFEGNKEKMSALLPPPLVPGPNPGLGVLWFVEWVSVSDSRPDLASVNPERSMYRECIVMIECQFEGVPGYYVPYIWVDNDFTLMRGFIQGFPKKLGSIYITRLHDYTPVIGGRKEGATMKGICVAHAERIVEGSLTLHRPIQPEEVPPVKFYLMRHLPDYENSDGISVLEITTSTVTNVKVGNAWAGNSEICLLPSPFEEVAELGPISPSGGYSFSIGITITGGKVLYRYT